MSNQQFFKDFTNMANGAMETMGAMKNEFEAIMKPYVEQMIKNMQLVTRDEFDTVKQMAIEARKENDALRKELDALKPKKAAPKKTTAKKKS